MGAKISDCGNYRYWLTRPGGVIDPDRGTALFVMLNPSTADAELDDQTIRKCRGFAESWGSNGITVVNLYALRSTDRKKLRTAIDPVGTDNDLHLRALLGEHREAVCAWGNHANEDRVQDFANMANRAGARLWCFGTNKNGSPKHPLYLRADTELVPFTIAT